MPDTIPGLLPATHDTGCRMSWPLLPGVTGTAEFRGENRQHRLTLERLWGDATAVALWIGMNPSGAEAHVDDLTVRKEQEWTRRLGLHRYVKMNVGTYRWTDSRTLHERGADLVHPENLPMIRTLAAEAAVIMLTTGEPPQPLIPAAMEMRAALRADSRRLLCLGTVKSGWPRHSSRVGYATPMVEFVP